MRSKLLVAAFLVLFVTLPAVAEIIDLGTSFKDVSVQVLESNDQRTVIKYNIGSFNQESVKIEGDTYYQLRLNDESFLLNEGEPELPRVCRSIIIPNDAQMEINILEKEYVDFDNSLIIPSKGNLKRNVNPEDVPYEFGPVYETDDFYPQNLAELREPFIMRDYRGTVVDLNAFQFNPAAKTLRVYTSITVEVKNVGPGVTNVLENSDNKVVPIFDRIYQRRFINYDQMAAKYDLIYEEGDLLVICYEPFMATMQPYVDWKNQKGIKTTMVSVLDVGNTSTAIDAYIEDFFDSTDLAYVLLVGDAAQVATPISYGGAADPTYCKILGSDNYVDLIIGRFSAETVAQCATQVERTLTYEQNPPAGDWFTKGFGIGSTQGINGHFGEIDSTHLNYIRDDLLGFTFTQVDKLYEPYVTSSMVGDSVNLGRSFGNYCGHGSTTSWSSSGFSNTDVNNLVNDNMLPYIVSVACVNGQFNGYTCFAEAWLRATHNGVPTGAIAMWASSVNQSWAPPMYAEDEATDLLVARTMETFGGICFNGSNYMLEQTNDIEMVDTWHIFGDPTVLLRTDVPSAMTVNYPPAVFFNVPSVDVEVVGVEGALCALYYDGTLYGSGYTDAGGNATITLTESLPVGGDVTLTVTAFNKEVFTGTISAASDLAIITEPLPDTKDTLNDYTVDCTIYSSANIYDSETLLHYDAGSGWNEITMSPLKIVEQSYQAYIPTQQAGTTVQYYITAHNEDDFYDTTETYSFEVIDYAMLLEPDHAESTAPVADIVYFDFRVVNNGVLADDYTLALSGNSWPTTIWSNDLSTEITSSGTLLMDEYLDFKVRVIVPSSYEGEFDEVTLTATSTATSDYLTATAKTISAGEPLPIPFQDLFATTTFTGYMWESTDGAEINEVGINEPSAPYSVNLNGDPSASDAIITEKINLKDETNIIVKYQYQRTGGGESPDAGDDLKVEYLNNVGSWITLNTHAGDGVDMTEFEEVELQVPSDGLHAEFRLSISCTATSGAYDDWFIDDIYIGQPSDYDVLVSPSYQAQYGPAGDYATYTLNIKNKGYLNDAFDLSYSGDWTATFYDEGTLDLITSTPSLAGGDSIDVIVKIAIPAAAPLHETKTVTVTATSQGDNNMSGFAMLETTSAGTAAGVPWYEIFPDDTLYTQHWFVFSGVEVTMEASNAPSMPFSFNFDGGVDTAVTQMIDLSGMSNVLLSYYYECGGLNNNPNAGDNLWIDYLNDAGVWVNLYTHEGGAAAMTEFEYMSHVLPADAHHSGLQIRIRSNGSADNEDNWYLDNIRIDYPPDMNVSMTSMDETLVQGESVEHELILTNNGDGGLVYDIDIVPTVRKSSYLASLSSPDMEPANHEYPDEVYADVPKGTDIQFDGIPNTRNMGGPDDFGYYWIDSDESGGPLFNWIDISSGGTDVIGDLDDDNYIGPFSIGFDFPFYGMTYNEVYIGSNGIIGFAPDAMDSRTSRPIPYSTIPNAILAWFWDDLDPTDTDNANGHVYYKAFADHFVISFVDYPEYRGDAGDVITAQVIIYADGSIRYQYQTIAPGVDIVANTVGIENHYGSDGLEVVYHTSYLKDNLAIEFFKPYDWLTIDQASGIVDPGQADTITCTVSTTTDLEPGDYTADLVIRSNDPANDPMTISANLTVNELMPYTCGDADGDTKVNVSDAVYIINYVFSGGAAPDPLEAGDVNCDENVNVSDAVYLIAYVFSGGEAPCAACK